MTSLFSTLALVMALNVQAVPNPAEAEKAPSDGQLRGASEILDAIKAGLDARDPVAAQRASFAMDPDTDFTRDQKRRFMHLSMRIDNQFKDADLVSDIYARIDRDDACEMAAFARVHDTSPYADEARTLGASCDLNFLLLDEIRAVPVFRAPPDYPENYRWRELEPNCQVMFDITPDGQTANAVAECLPVSGQDRAGFIALCEDAVLGWEYIPRSIEGKPVWQRNVIVEFPFRLMP